MTEEYMIRGAFFAAGVLSMAVWHGVHVFMSNRPEKDVYGLYSVTRVKSHEEWMKGRSEELY